MTLLFIMIFPALKHESLIIYVSLYSILFPKCFHSAVTVFKFHPGCTLTLFGVSLPLPHLLTHTLSSLKSSWEQPYAKKKKKERSFQLYLFQWNFPAAFFPYQWMFFASNNSVNSVRKMKPLHENITRAFAKANISVMKLIFLDSLSNLCAGKGFLQRQFRAVTSFHGE